MVEYQLFAIVSDDRENLSENGHNSLLKIPRKPLKIFLSFFLNRHSLITDQKKKRIPEKAFCFVSVFLQTVYSLFSHHFNKNLMRKCQIIFFPIFSARNALHSIGKTLSYSWSFD